MINMDLLDLRSTLCPSAYLVGPTVCTYVSEHSHPPEIFGVLTLSIPNLSLI